MSLRDAILHLVDGAMWDAWQHSVPKPRWEEATTDALMDLLQGKAERVWDCPDGDACWGVPPDCPHNGRWLLQFVEADWEGR